MRLARTAHGRQLEVGHRWIIADVDHDDRMLIIELGSGTSRQARCVRLFISPFDWRPGRGESTGRRELVGRVRWWKLGPVEVMLRTDGASVWRYQRPWWPGT